LDFENEAGVGLQGWVFLGLDDNFMFLRFESHFYGSLLFMFKFNQENSKNHLESSENYSNTFSFISY